MTRAASSNKPLTDQVAQVWKSRGFSCGIWQDPPAQVWEDFVHSMDELLMLMEGEIELEMEGRVLHPKVGEEVLIPAKSRHSVRNTGKTANRWLYGYKQ